MTHDDVVDVLTAAAAFDRRTIGEADVLAWHAAIGDLPAADAMTAVIAHYRESRDWLMPSDVVGRVRAVQAARLAAVPDPDPRELGVDPDDPVACREALRAHRRAVADGTHPDLPGQIEGPR
jgi:hypothetical protein